MQLRAVIAAEKAYFVQLSVTEITMSVLQPASMLVKCVPPPRKARGVSSHVPRCCCAEGDADVVVQAESATQTMLGTFSVPTRYVAIEAERA